jgi:hypothetical protein
LAERGGEVDLGLRVGCGRAAEGFEGGGWVAGEELGDAEQDERLGVVRREAEGFPAQPFGRGEAVFRQIAADAR